MVIQPANDLRIGLLALGLVGRLRLPTEKPARKAVAARRLRFVARWRRKNGRSEPLVAALLQRGALAREIKGAADRLIGEAPALEKAGAALTLLTRRGQGAGQRGRPVGYSAHDLRALGGA